MKIVQYLLIGFVCHAAAEEARLSTPVPEGEFREIEGTPWLGLTTDRIDGAIRAQVPDLPQGIGFVVASVSPNGPAEKAGLTPYDILWKFDDQLIANEAQLFTLLRLRKAGEVVPLWIYRQGEEQTLQVTLEVRTDDRVLVQAELPAEVRDVPMKVLNPTESSAMLELPDGRAVLTIVDGISEVTITSQSSSVIYQGRVYDSQGVCLVPQPWERQVGALERGLAHAMKVKNLAPRPARNRALPRNLGSSE